MQYLALIIFYPYIDGAYNNLGSVYFDVKWFSGK